MQDADISRPARRGRARPAEPDLARADQRSRGARRRSRSSRPTRGGPPSGKRRRLILRFLVSPVAVLDGGGAVGGLRLVRNRLVASAAGTIQAQPTDQFEDLPAGLVFRSVGYRGVPLPGVPFDEKWSVVLNEKGRVLDADTKQPLPGEYTAGLDQARARAASSAPTSPTPARRSRRCSRISPPGATLQPAEPDAAAAERLVRQRQPAYISYADWLRLNELEIARGRAPGSSARQVHPRRRDAGRPREPRTVLSRLPRWRLRLAGE